MVRKQSWWGREGCQLSYLCSRIEVEELWWKKIWVLKLKRFYLIKVKWPSLSYSMWSSIINLRSYTYTPDGTKLFLNRPSQPFNWLGSWRETKTDINFWVSYRDCLRPSQLSRSLNQMIDFFRTLSLSVIKWKRPNVKQAWIWP